MGWTTMSAYTMVNEGVRVVLLYYNRSSYLYRDTVYISCWCNSIMRWVALWVRMYSNTVYTILFIDQTVAFDVVEWPVAVPPSNNVCSPVALFIFYPAHIVAPSTKYYLIVQNVEDQNFQGATLCKTKNYMNHYCSEAASSLKKSTIALIPF